METTNFYSLPYEIQLDIFSYLTDKELCLDTTVSSIFNLLLNDDQLWKPRAKAYSANLKEGYTAKQSYMCKVQTDQMWEIMKGAIIKEQKAMFKRMDAARKREEEALREKETPDSAASSSEAPPSDTEDYKKVEKHDKKKARKIKKMNSVFRQMFPEVQNAWVSEHGNKNRKAKSEFKAYKKFLKNKSNKQTVQEAIEKEIENGHLKYVKTICQQGFTPDLFTLKAAVRSKKLEIVEYFMDNWGEKFERELKKKKKQKMAINF